MVKMSIFSSRINAASAYDFLDPHNFGDDGIGNQHLPIFSFKSISMATTNFSQSNKLGKGGFGTVYKVLFLKIMILENANSISTSLNSKMIFVNCNFRVHYLEDKR